MLEKINNIIAWSLAVIITIIVYPFIWLHDTFYIDLIKRR